MKKKMQLVIIVLLIQTAFSLLAADELFPDNITDRKWNTGKRFRSVLNQNTYVFMVGNDNYTPASGLQKLNQCGNDVELLKNIFIYCCKIPGKNIHTYRDMRLGDWEKSFGYFLKIPGKNSTVIFCYSGHGRRDGALLFIGGNPLLPGDLRMKINSFPHDTVLLIDACYSGNNDGPLQINTQPFKQNCLRIYGSLAHQKAKEISYKDEPFFRGIGNFYKEVLHMGSPSEGNGYFTALIALFFAGYQLGPYENISFSDLVFHIIQNHTAYLEFSKMHNSDTGEFRGRLITSPRKGISANQIPKMVPADKELKLQFNTHRYLLYQSNPRPRKNHLSLSLIPEIPIPLDSVAGYYSPGWGLHVNLHYNLFTNYGIFGIGFSGGGSVPGIREDVAANVSSISTFTAALDAKYLIDVNARSSFLRECRGGFFLLREKPMMFL